jgi:hypothetical protein
MYLNFSASIMLLQGRIFLTSFLSRDEAFSGIISRMKLLGHAMETMSPPALDMQTTMLLDSSDSRKGVMRSGGSNHRRSMSLGGSIDLSIQNDAVTAVSGADAPGHNAMSQAASTFTVDSAAHELRVLAENGSSAADVAVEAAANYVVSTSPFLPQLARCKMLLSIASCDALQQPIVPSSHVAPLVDLQLPVSVQEFFLCFISDDHQFNSKVMISLRFFCECFALVFLSRHCLSHTRLQYHAALSNYSICSTPWQAADSDNPDGRLTSNFEWKQKAKSGLGRCVPTHVKSLIVLMVALQHVWSKRNTLFTAMLRFSVIRYDTLHHKGGGSYPCSALRRLVLLCQLHRCALRSRRCPRLRCQYYRICGLQQAAELPHQRQDCE